MERGLGAAEDGEILRKAGSPVGGKRMACGVKPYREEETDRFGFFCGSSSLEWRRSQPRRLGPSQAKRVYTSPFCSYPFYLPDTEPWLIPPQKQR